MKTLLTIMAFYALSINGKWQTDFNEGCKIAKEKNQLVLLNFSGSDWCIPCIRMHKEIFGNADFLQMADSTLIMYNADFPRNKKNALPKALKEQNEALADKYNTDGKFPLTLLMTADGKVLKTWDGYSGFTASEFAKQVKNICDANRH